MIENIKLPVTFALKVLFQFHIIFRNRISLLGNEANVSRNSSPPDQSEWLVIFQKVFHLRQIRLRQTHRIRNAWPYLGSVCQEIIVMIIKHYTYTHCTFRLHINS